MITLLNTEPISKLVDELPAKSMTTLVLGALDFAVPGQWQHYPNFHDMAKAITGEHREGKLQALCNHADQLYNEGERGAQRAVWIYQSVDGSDRMLAAASLAHQLGDSVGVLNFLSKITPEPDSLQALDLGLKIAAEGLLQVSANIPGQQPRTLVSTQAKPPPPTVAAESEADSTPPTTNAGPQVFDEAAEVNLGLRADATLPPLEAGETISTVPVLSSQP